jgi:hypothetical protein
MRLDLYSGIILDFILSSPQIRQVGSELESNLAKERSTLHFRHRDKRETGRLRKLPLETQALGRIHTSLETECSSLRNIG